MSELDDFLARSLKTVAAALREERSERAVAARADLWRRYRRRRVVRYATVAVTVGVTAAVAAFAGAHTDTLFHGGPAPATVVPAPPAGVYIRVAKDPTGVSVRNGFAWVASGSGRLTKVDAGRNKSVAVIQVGGEPSDVAVTNDRVWFSDAADGSIKSVDASSGVFAGNPIPIGTTGHIDVDVGPKGTVWATSHDSSSLVGIDASTNELVQRFYPSTPVEVGVAPGALWALADDGASLTRFGFASQEVELDVAIDDAPKTDLAVTPASVFVAEADGTILVLDAATGHVRTRLHAGGTNPELAAGDGVLWVASDGGDGRGLLERFELTTLDRAGSPSKFLGTPTDIALGDGSVWVTDSARETVIRLKASAE